MTKALTILALVLAAGVLERQEFEAQGQQCVALVVFYEARGEPWAGQEMVAQVVRNRAVDDDLCAVAMKPHQFQGLSVPVRRPPWLIDPEAWERAQEVAELVLMGDADVAEDCKRATHFAQRGVLMPGKLLCSIGAHDFYAAE